ncbi:hypothetical protein MHBO_003183 [Bonamia ostreae]|uniref:Kinesin motor domain-containing protein n=1 Tax=Bonamia ostreae TaxID=126728 RepID=A0ABV2AQF7_9EUKA
MSNKYSISVAVRVKPFLSGSKETKSTVDIAHKQIVNFDIGDTSRPLGSIGKRRKKNQHYAFDCVFSPEDSTKTVYDKMAKSAVIDALNGYNATIFAYGATGSGKTHTMIGNSRGGPGIIVLAMYDIYTVIEKRFDECAFNV